MTRSGLTCIAGVTCPAATALTGVHVAFTGYRLTEAAIGAGIAHTRIHHCVEEKNILVFNRKEGRKTGRKEGRTAQTILTMLGLTFVAVQAVPAAYADTLERIATLISADGSILARVLGTGIQH